MLYRCWNAVGSRYLLIIVHVWTRWSSLVSLLAIQLRLSRENLFYPDKSHMTFWDNDLNLRVVHGLG